MVVAIVDDEEPVRHALKRLMISAGFGVKAYASGADFLASLASSRPHCVILDLHMPVMSGFEVQAKLRQSNPEVPVVVITGNDTSESHGRALAEGAASYLRKPVDDQELIDAVESAVARARAGAHPP